MSCSYAGIPCLDPAQELRNCRQRGHAMPWAGVANSFVCPQGQSPGRGRVLMLRGDLDNNIDLEQPQPLVFHDGTNVVTLPRVVFVRGYAATPGGRGDPTAAYWCELADVRLLAQLTPIDRAYNVRSTPGGAYYSATLRSGVAWTWTQMVQDLWDAVVWLDVYPGLPFSPDGTPEAYVFYGGASAFDALGVVLDRLGCVLGYDPIADTFHIEQLGATDPALRAALTTADPACVWDADPVEPVLPRVPITLRVFFGKQLSAPDTTGGSPFYFLDQTDPTPGGPLAATSSDVIATVYDDLPAIYSGSTLTNASSLSARAQERAADFFRRVRQTRLYRAYTGGAALPGLLPGPQLTATIWRDTGAGLITEVVSIPDVEGQGAFPFAGLAGFTAAGGGWPVAGGPAQRTMPGLEPWGPDLDVRIIDTPGLRTSVGRQGGRGRVNLTLDTAVSGASDHKVLVASDDTTPDFLLAKLVAGNNVTLTKNNAGSNETITIAAAGSAVSECIVLDPNGSAVSQSIPSGANTNLTFASVNLDTDSYYNSSTPDRLTAHQGGLHLLTISGSWSATGGSFRRMTLQRTRSGVIVSTPALVDIPATVSKMTLTALFYMTSGTSDYINIVMFQDTGGSAVWATNSYNLRYLG